MSQERLRLAQGSARQMHQMPCIYTASSNYGTIHKVFIILPTALYNPFCFVTSTQPLQQLIYSTNPAASNIFPILCTAIISQANIQGINYVTTQ